MGNGKAQDLQLRCGSRNDLSRPGERIVLAPVSGHFPWCPVNTAYCTYAVVNVSILCV